MSCWQSKWPDRPNDECPASLRDWKRLPNQGNRNAAHRLDSQSREFYRVLRFLPPEFQDGVDSDRGRGCRSDACESVDLEFEMFKKLMLCVMAVAFVLTAAEVSQAGNNCNTCCDTPKCKLPKLSLPKLKMPKLKLPKLNCLKPKCDPCEPKCCEPACEAPACGTPACGESGAACAAASTAPAPAAATPAPAEAAPAAPSPSAADAQK